MYETYTLIATLHYSPIEKSDLMVGTYVLYARTILLKLQLNAISAIFLMKDIWINHSLFFITKIFSNMVKFKEIMEWTR